MTNEIAFALLAFRTFRILGRVISLQKLAEVFSFLLTVSLKLEMILNTFSTSCGQPPSWHIENYQEVFQLQVGLKSQT